MSLHFIFKIINKSLIPVLILSLIAVYSCGGEERDDSEPPIGTAWTIMYYGDADNNLEEAILADIVEMKASVVDNQGINVIVLIDRIGYIRDESTLGEDFTDTRLYRITGGKAWRKSGSAQFPEITAKSSYEANMGDAQTLKKFIQFCKANYPASNYALILSNHGGGPMKNKLAPSLGVTFSSSIPEKEICYDTTNGGDVLYTAEISDSLTSAESVQLLALDACYMSSVEFAYQFRSDGSNPGFKAEIMVASAPSETGLCFDYKAIFKRLQGGGGDNGTADATLGGNELYYDPVTLTATQFGAVIVEEQRDSTSGDGSQSLTCLDLSKVSNVKTAVDSLSVKLAGGGATVKTSVETLRGKYPTANLLHYFAEASESNWISYPYFDIYNLAAAINGSGSFSSAIQNDALNVMTAVDAMVLYSFANSDYNGHGFIEGKSGVHIFFPDGDYTGGHYSNTHWSHQYWYNPLAVSALPDIYGHYAYGRLAWCQNGATAYDSIVENWFELLDSWYDDSTANAGKSYNYYQW